MYGQICIGLQVSVGQYHILTSGIRYYKLITVFRIPLYFIKQVDEPLNSVNGKPQKIL